MPEGGECTLVVVPGGAEVRTGAVGRVQTPSRLGEREGRARKGGKTHTHARIRTHTQTHADADVTHKGNGTNVVRKMD